MRCGRWEDANCFLPEEITSLISGSGSSIVASSWQMSESYKRTNARGRPRSVNASQPSRMRCKKRLVRQAGGELIDIERLVEARVQSLGIDQQADLGGLASEQPTETWV